jgi:hypothetical protein
MSLGRAIEELKVAGRPVEDSKVETGCAAAHLDNSPLRGERVARAARFHQRARDG